MGRGKHIRQVQARPFRRLRVSILGGTLLGVLLFAGGAVASAPGPHDITDPGDVADLNDGALIEQSFLAVVGTGNLNPFVRIQASPVEDGYNTSHRLSGNPKIVYHDGSATDDTTDPSTHDLLLNTVPIVSFEGSLYREFRLDLNEDQSSGVLLSLDDVRIWTGIHPFINNLNIDTDEYEHYSSANSQTSDGTATGTPVWSLEDGWWVVMDSSLSAGSGNLGDARLLVPVGDFGEAGEACPYNPTADCDYFVYFYSQFGVHNPAESTFEEWSVRDVPFITKTVETSFISTFPWTIEKTVDPDEHHLFDGDSDDSTYTVTATKGEPIDSDWTVSGTITITNPGDDVTIETVTDAIAAAGGGTIAAAVECEETLPFELGSGDSLVCTYEASADPAATDNPFGDTNTATFTYDLDGNEDAGAVVEDVDFSAATVTEVDGTVDVIDEFGSDPDLALGTVSETTTFEDYDRTFDCSDVAFESGATTSDTVSYTNTASVKVGDTVLDSDTETVDVTCYRPTISKDATTSFTRTFGWTIEKDVTPASHDLFDGDSDDSTYTVTVTKDAGTDTGHVVSGSILITNPHPTDDMVIDDLTDVLTGDATVVSITGCSGTGVTFLAGVLTVPAGETANCDYSASVAGTTATANTASFTLFGLSYSDSADVIWGSPETVVNDTVDVIDEFGSDPEQALGTVSETTTFPDYDRTFDCSDVTFESGATTSDTVQHPNTASVKSGETVLDTDSETVDVTCHRLAVSKTVNTSHTRDYDWSISKGRFIAPGEDDGDGDPLTLILDEGQTHTASYEVVVTMTGFTDTDHAVDGVITVANPASILAEDVVVTDVLSITGASAVDCDPVADGDQATVDIPAVGSVDCTYTADVADGTAQANIATATLFGIDYHSATEDVTFGDPTTELDDCIDVVDDAGTPGDTSDDIDLGTVCVEDLVAGSKTLTYTLEIGPFTPCGTYEFTNTASFATSDQDGEGDDTGTATYTVTIDVPCPEGCTLTLGYWQTHSSQGPAPFDDTWALIGEDTTFFLSGVSWLEAIQANPQGNAYWILAQQYVAAQLNFLTGADAPPEVVTAFNDATALFTAWTPAEIGALKGNDAIRQEFLAAADVLASYNEGDIGPGHCDEVTPIEPVQEASTLPLAVTGLSIALMAAAAHKGRYARKDMLME